MEAPSLRRTPRPPPAEASLESLPSEIRERIVALLPVRDAVRTSAISRAWRGLWKSAPGLALDWDCGADPAHADAVLALYSLPVRSFSFRFSEESFRRSDDWVRLLAGKGIQILNLRFIRDMNTNVEPHYMDVSIFSCRELTQLQLSFCHIPAAPLGLAGFPNLTKLYLFGVRFPDDGVRGLESLIAESPLLEVLRLSYIFFPVPEEHEVEDWLDYLFGEWVIQSPNLRELSIVSNFDQGWQIEELPSIEIVDINIFSYAGSRDFVKLLTSLARVRKLELTMPCRMNNALEGLSCSFENLRILSLHTVFSSLSTISETVCLLKNAPNLEELSIQIQSQNVQHDEVGVDLLNAQWADVSVGNLTSVSMGLATCRSNEMHFIEFVLSKARRLQEFRICAAEYCSKSNEELALEILKYRRASPEAKGLLQPHGICIRQICETCKLPLVAFSPQGKL